MATATTIHQSSHTMHKNSLILSYVSGNLHQQTHLDSVGQPLQPPQPPPRSTELWWHHPHLDRHKRTKGVLSARTEMADLVAERAAMWLECCRQTGRCAGAAVTRCCLDTACWKTVVLDRHQYRLCTETTTTIIIIIIIMHKLIDIGLVGSDTERKNSLAAVSANICIAYQ